MYIIIFFFCAPCFHSFCARLLWNSVHSEFECQQKYFLISNVLFNKLRFCYRNTGQRETNRPIVEDERIEQNTHTHQLTTFQTRKWKTLLLCTITFSVVEMFSMVANLLFYGTIFICWSMPNGIKYTLYYLLRSLKLQFFLLLLLLLLLSVVVPLCSCEKNGFGSLSKMCETFAIFNFIVEFPVN